MRPASRVRRICRTLRRRWRREQGQAIVVVAVSMVFIAGFLALTLDVGYAYAQRRKVQNAADAATQAAARLIALNSACYGELCPPYGDDDVTDAVAQYAGLNTGSINPSDPPVYIDVSGQGLAAVGSGTIPPAAAGVVITTTSTFPSFFAAVLGHSQISVQTRASAVMGVSEMQSQSRPRDLVPLAVPEQDFINNSRSQYDLWGPQYGQGYNLPPDFKALLNLNAAVGPSASAGASCSPLNDCLSQWSQYGFDGRIAKDNVIPIVSGDRRSQVDDSLVDYCGAQNRSDSGGAYGLFKLAVFDTYNAATSSIHISGFAQFKVYCSTIGNSMSGRFVSYMAPGAKILPGGDTSVPGPRVVMYVEPFTGLPAGAGATATSTPVGGSPSPKTAATPTGTPAALTQTPTPGATQTPTAVLTETPTPIPTVSPTPTRTRTVTPTPTHAARSYTVLGWTAAHSAVTTSRAVFQCDAGPASAGPIAWTSQGNPGLYFVVWPDGMGAPDASDVPFPVASGSSFAQQLPTAGWYTVYAYNDGNSNKNATVPAFTVTCQ